MKINFNPNQEDIEHAFEFVNIFKPTNPCLFLNSKNFYFIKGIDHQYLHVYYSCNVNNDIKSFYEEEKKRETEEEDISSPITQKLLKPFKPSEKRYAPQIYDPMSGMLIEYKSFNDSHKIDNFVDIYHPNEIKQIIMINLDESQLIFNDLIENDTNENLLILYQCLESLTNRLLTYSIPSFHGLISFSDDIKIKCPFTIYSDEFEKKCFNSFNPSSKSKLWDSIALSCNEIYKFRKDTQGNEIYPNAISRIIVISSGEDSESSIKIENLVKELVKNKIVVDFIVFNSSSKKQYNDICAVCHATGGFSFHLKDFSEIISIFEDDAFINIEEREISNQPLIPGDRKSIQSYIKPLQITKSFMSQIAENEQFDIKIPNKISQQELSKTHLITPQYYLKNKTEKKTFNSRIKRIMKEIKKAAEVCDNKSDQYDDRIKIYLHKSNVDKWIVFLKGIDGTLYENKWLWLYVSFPELYPYQPPIIRFITVPYHLNITNDGHVCISILENMYYISRNVVDIIYEINELLLLPSIDSFVKYDLYDIFLNDRNKYDELARKNYNEIAKDDYHDFLQSSFVEDDS